MHPQLCNSAVSSKALHTDFLRQIGPDVSDAGAKWNFLICLTSAVMTVVKLIQLYSVLAARV